MTTDEANTNQVVMKVIKAIESWRCKDAAEVLIDIRNILADNGWLGRENDPHT